MYSQILDIHIEAYCSCIFDLPQWALPPFNKINFEKDQVTYTCKQGKLAHSNRKVGLIFQVSQ